MLSRRHAAAAPASSSSSGASSSSSRACQQPRALVPRCRRAGPVRAAGGDEPAGNVCKTCGMELSKAPGGCDREGRIIGGLAALPGFGWWPIKAYKPCSGLSSAGMDYVRKGQATNEMLFGGVSLSPGQQESLGQMKDIADKGLDVEV